MIKLFLGLCAAVAVSLFVFSRNSQMSDNWVAPYFSAAKNLTFGGEFLINIPECNYFKGLPPKDQLFYHFRETSSLSHYNHNPLGYSYLIWLGTKIFFFTGHQMAILLLQLFVHLLLCAAILWKLRNKPTAFYFFMLSYLINPVILKYVTFNFYYFWQAIPGLLLILMILDDKKRIWYPIIFALFFPYLLNTRMTLVLSMLFFLGFIIKFYRWYVPVFATVIFIALYSFINKPTEKNLWHTVYIGIAAYENPYINDLSDKEGYKLYENVTGERLNASIGGNYYNTNTVRKYQEITKNKVYSIFQQNPGLFLRNAMLNSFQIFSFGYFNKGGDLLNYLSSLIGLVLVLWLIYLRKFLLILLIAAPSITFTGFYPPIPAYMYGSYIFLAVAYYFVLKDIASKIKNNI